MECGGMKDDCAYYLKQAKTEWVSAMGQIQEGITLQQWGESFFSEVMVDLKCNTTAEKVMKGASALIEWLESLPLTWPFASPAAGTI